MMFTANVTKSNYSDMYNGRPVVFSCWYSVYNRFDDDAYVAHEA